MTNQSKQIIPDSQSVARCLDSETLKVLDSHGTFTIEELLKKINQPFGSLLGHFLSTDKLRFFIYQIKCVSNYGPPDFHKDINDVIKMSGKSIPTGETAHLFSKIRTDENYAPSNLFKDISSIIFPKPDKQSILNIFINGTNISLLSPDGKGWQKGKLKICFEFTPEESKSIVKEEESVEIQCSSLDEIRQLANNLLIDQN
jgi:KGK domain